MPVTSVPTSRIRDWETFHDVFADALGFPDFYGCNMDASIDRLLSADDEDARMVRPDVVARPGEVLSLALDEGKPFRCSTSRAVRGLDRVRRFVNWARIEEGERPILALSFSM
jgi:barstar (barnase inhibitor)